MQGEVTLLDADGMRRALARIAYEMIERAGADLSTVVLIGVRTRGWHLARRLAQRVAEIEGVRL
ncbi:MAG: bifunctional pyr operon transcriptional regulator/uracil phosphoribosyltransferase, partial [Firmicutes bacterium]|nr:bifunctional pyr operon transcriptional regulator/uracil phosphoribosyltransferase [Bacillota bacterium]